MSLDPTEYDISELRRLAGVADPQGAEQGVPDGGSSDRIGPPGDGPPFRSGGPPGDRPEFPPRRSPAGPGDDELSGRVLSYQRGATDAMLSRPYLPRVPDSYTGVATVFEWLQQLLSAAGDHRTRQALAYYQSIEWISEEAREDLETYLEGMTDPDPDSRRDLSMDDHRRSLLYVARLTAEVYS